MIAPASEPATVSPVAATAATHRPRPAKRLRFLLRLALIAPLVLLTHCAGKGYQAASYSAEKLATPAHNMSQRDYPFDADGNYRKDWVKNGSTRPGSANIGSKRSRSSAPAPASTTVAANTRYATAPTRSSTSSAPRTISPPRTTVPTASTSATSTTTYRPAPAPAPKPKPKPTPPPARYHRVEAKQTLWAISQKYGVTVAALQRANGLSGTLIRPGQSLRIP